MSENKRPTSVPGVKTSGQHSTFWLDSASPAVFSSLKKDMIADVVVVGGGIAGLSVAYFLSKLGKSVVVVEDGHIGSGETGRTSAHLSNALDDRYYELARIHGKENARLLAQGHTTAIDTVFEIARSEGISCELERVTGYLFDHPHGPEDAIDEEFFMTRELGIETNLLERIPGIPSIETPCLEFHGQAQFHPMKYIHGLCAAITRYGGSIFTKTHAQVINKRGVITRDGHSISANYVVVATNSPVNDTLVIHTKQAAYRTYLIGVRVPKGSVPQALYWDTGDKRLPGQPYHYVRVQALDAADDLLLVGGEDHKTGQGNGKSVGRRFEELETWAKEHFPMITTVEYRWSGQVMEPVDGVAFIGRNPLDGENVFIATGDSGNGLTHGTIAGLLITDLILGRENPWEEVFRPDRMRLKALGEFVSENANAVKNFSDYFTAGDVDTYQALGAGQGAVLRDGVAKVAVYKDEKGEMHAFSAVCPHIGCIVHWNEGEKTFDCPCHGSRFGCLGQVMNGPANSDLKPLGYELGAKPQLCESDDDSHPV